MTLAQLIQLAQPFIIIGFGLFVFWLISQLIKYTTSGYVSLEHRNKSTFRNTLEGIIGFVKIFKFW